VEGVRVNDPSVGEPKTNPDVMRLEQRKENRMKSLTGLLQRSFSSSETKFASMALIITVALFSLAAGSGDDNDQERGKHHAPQIEGPGLSPSRNRNRAAPSISHPLGPSAPGAVWW